MSELRIGVIGVCGRGGIASHAHQPGQGARIVAGADPRPGHLERFSERYGVPEDGLFDDYRKLLHGAEVDAVFICSPDPFHEEQAVAALEAGKHIYLEKPMAITIEGCDRVLRAAFESRRRLFLGHNMRHMRVMRKMKELVDAGTIGEVKAGWCRHFVGHGGDFYFQDWHAERCNTTGLLLQKGAHDIDILHWLCGGYSKRVTGMGGLTVYGSISHRGGEKTCFMSMDHWPPLSQKVMNPAMDVEDLSLVLMELDNGVFCSYQQCHYTPDYWRNYCVIGTEGRLENFGDMPGHSVIRVWNRRTDYHSEGDAQHHIPAVEGGHGGADPEIVAEFLAHVKGACDRVATSPIAARNSVAAGVQATLSLRNGGVPMDVPPVAEELVRYFEGGPAG